MKATCFSNQILNSFTIFPSLYNKTAHFICDVYSENGHPFESYPRNILKKVSAEAQEMGYQFNVSPELEFFLVKQDSSETTDSMGYCESAQLDKHHKIKLVILNVLNALEMQPEKTHHEVAPGQHEITFKYGEAVWTADRILMAKTIIKQIAQENGLKATFMPKPFFGKTGSGMHINYSLYDIENNKNAFYDPSGEHHLSEIAKSFIAGNLDNISGMTAILNATVNSYKRLVKGYEAPVYIGWAAKNRSALIRIPQAEVGESIRAELRSPDATCDPYLALAIILKSGLVGVKAKKALTLEFKENLFKLTPKEIEARNIKALPHSLEEALIEMEKNTLVKETLGENLFSTYIKLKKQEVQEYNIFVTDWEVEKYL